MALTIRKVAAQRAEINQKHYKKDNFYIIPIEIVFIYYPGNLCPELFFIAKINALVALNL